ncbi:uncharacterized protein [Salvelinus sp. IW2-2015]|uniref:uncharacterized protein isoform X2 n=1 Tax=Salvelinus sp. IW2-2015 TaxID=2691554 RepID=UPI000CDFDFC9|nr:uncharacterized protein LOC111958219 isoform X2 [Salvelinus alpinus]
MDKLQGPREYVDEMLHSIFFLGWIHSPKYTPEMILGDHLSEMMKKIFPQPFESYTRKLPKRTPFSCVLDMVVSWFGPDQKSEIWQKLRDIANVMSGKHRFTSSTICISESGGRYYGASMSCTGKKEGQIMIAVSCLCTWHYGVSNAVMTYKPDKNKRKNFDGTMKLQEYVKCQASNVKSGEEIPPCKSCGNLFGLEKPSNQMWPYGNCAEAESLSKLLYGEEEIVKKVVPPVDCEMREQVVKEVKAHLEEKLQESEFQWDSSYYIPQ